MKKQMYEIDENGYIKEILVGEFDEDGNPLEPLAANIITISPPNGLYRAKWTGTEWIEDMTQEEIDALNNQPRGLTEIEFLQEENSKLKTRLYETEIATAETSSMQEQLIEILIEMGVI